MAQFRVEFVLDQASGKYLAEMYNPENQNELLVRTEALYPSEAAAVLGLVQLFKNAALRPRRKAAAPRKANKPNKANKARARGRKRK